MTERKPVTGACAWLGRDMAGSTRWIRTLSESAVAEIDGALRKAEAARIAWAETNSRNFPLPGLAGELKAVAEELENGSGIVKLKGLPVERYAPAQLKQIWFGIGANLGRPVFQNARGELMREIRDEGEQVGKRYGELKPADGGTGTFLSSYARTLTNGPLRFHTDRTDVVGLLCVAQARQGGVSRLTSSVAVHNEMLKRRPDLDELLFQDIYRSRFGEEAGSHEDVYPLPIFGIRDGKFTSHYSLTYIEAAQMVAGVPKLSQKQRDAIDLLMALAAELSFDMVLEPGDMQFVNNHVVYHARTAFEDDAGQGRSRLLYRIWLSMPNSRALPENHAVLWRNVEAGQPRGGIAQVAR
jgi:hypothetical protein